MVLRLGKSNLPPAPNTSSRIAELTQQLEEELTKSNTETSSELKRVHDEMEEEKRRLEQQMKARVIEVRQKYMGELTHARRMHAETKRHLSLEISKMEGALVNANTQLYAYQTMLANYQEFVREGYEKKLAKKEALLQIMNARLETLKTDNLIKKMLKNSPITTQ